MLLPNNVLFVIFFLGMFAVAYSRKNELKWLVVGAKEVFETQDNLDLLMHKYIQDEFENLLNDSSKYFFNTSIPISYLKNCSNFKF